MRYPDPELADDVVHLRPWAAGDLECVREASADEAITSGTTVPSVFTEQSGRAFIDRQLSRATGDEGLSLAIADARSGVARGLLWLGVRPQPGVLGLGFWLVPSARGLGLAHHAIRLATAWAVSTGTARVEAWAEPSNEPSHAVLRASGFTREGTLRSFLTLGPTRSDATVYSYISSDYP
jgi:RimJ/RimL family protein N-acetyltransferase